MLKNGRKNSMRPKVLFVFDHKYEDSWKDGLWAALELLNKDFEIFKSNLHGAINVPTDPDFILGWGGFNSSVDQTLREMKGKKGLCIGGNAFKPDDLTAYDVLFYETEWVRHYLDLDLYHKNLVHAFGVNTDIYWKSTSPKIWDYLTVGAFANWKRQEKLGGKPGTKLAIGEIQEGNPDESFTIIGHLLRDKVAISDMVDPETLCKIYNASKTVYIPADINGGGERAVWEAKVCGCNIEVEFDNPKLLELLSEKPKDHHFYAEQLKKGILSCLN